MSSITTADGVQLHYSDAGEGRPVILIHGWPLSGESFAANVNALVATNHRVIAYDRRGFGQSDKPASGYDYDTLADDLHAMMEQLDLRDAVVLGLSMGGGDVLRYLTKHGDERVAGIVLAGSVAPMLGITSDNPDGAMPLEEFEKMAQSYEADPSGFLDGFVDSFFSNADGLQISEQQRDTARAIAAQADVHAAASCIRIFPSDLREDCRRVTVPTLLIHGDGDQNVPLDASSKRAHDMIQGSKLVIIEGGTHGANLSHQAEWERAVIDFSQALPAAETVAE